MIKPLFATTSRKWPPINRLQNSRVFFSKSVMSHSLFSASFQTFYLTAHAYLNTQKYRLFCSLTYYERPSFISDHGPSLAWRFYNRCKRPSDAWCGLFVHTPPGCILVSNQLPYATTNSLHFGWSLIRGSSVVMPSNMMHPKWIDSKF